MYQVLLFKFRRLYAKGLYDIIREFTKRTTSIKKPSYVLPTNLAIL